MYGAKTPYSLEKARFRIINAEKVCLYYHVYFRYIGYTKMYLLFFILY